MCWGLVAASCNCQLLHASDTGCCLLSALDSFSSKGQQIVCMLAHEHQCAAQTLPGGSYAAQPIKAGQTLLQCFLLPGWRSQQLCMTGRPHASELLLVQPSKTSASGLPIPTGYDKQHGHMSGSSALGNKLQGFAASILLRTVASCCRASTDLT